MTIELLNRFATERGFELAEDQLQYAFDNADNITDYEMSEEEYDELLDCDGPVDVCGMKFYPSTILKQCDPIAYRCGMSDCQEYYYTFNGENYTDKDDAIVALIEDAIENA